MSIRVMMFLSTKLIVRTSLTLGFLSACLAFAVLNISKGHLRSLSISICYVGWQVNKKKLSERSTRRISMYSNIKPENRLLDSEGKLKFSYLGLGALLQEASCIEFFSRGGGKWVGWVA
ncbi:hypothetical protein Tco_0455790 [Tanacetum coccineum]